MARLLFVLFTGLTAVDATATQTSASCYLGQSSQTVSDPSASACAIPAANPVVDANAQVSANFTPFSGDLFTSVGSGVNSANIPAETFYQLRSGATTDNIPILTSGPVRQGLISFDFEATSVPGGSADAFIVDGAQEYTLQVGEGFNCHPCSYAATMPITLGSSDFFVSDESGTFLSGTFSNGVPISQAASMDLKFSLFEANAVTPVEMSAIVPEPPTFRTPLAGGAIVLTLFFARRIRARKLRSEGAGCQWNAKNALAGARYCRQ